MSDSSPRVLLIDSTSDGDNVARALEEAGCDLDRVMSATAQEALGRPNPPDLAILNMEGDDALVFCDEIRALPRGAGVAVILVGGPDSAVSSTADAILRGADAFVSRPVGTDELLRKVSSLVGPLRAIRESQKLAMMVGQLRQPTEILQESDIEAANPPPEPRGFEPAPQLESERTSEELVPALFREPTQIVEDLSEITRPSERIEGDNDSDETSSETTRPSEKINKKGSEEDESETTRPSEKVVGGKDADPSETTRPSERIEEDDDIGDDTSQPTRPSQRIEPDQVAGQHLLRREATEVLVDDGPQGGMEKALDNMTDVFSRNAALLDDDPLSLNLDRMLTAEQIVGVAEKPESTQILRNEDLPGGESSALSAEFRRVIDRVAQRLFPEVNPQDYEESLDEIKTVVPLMGDHEQETPVDDFALESMDTYPGDEAGLTLSLFHELTMPREDNQPSTDIQLRNAEVAAQEPPAAVEVPDEAGSPPPADPAPMLRVGEETLSRGQLQQYPFPVVLAASVEGRVSARVVVRRGGASRWKRPIERVLVLREGHIEVAASTLPSDRLLEMLRLRGRLTATQCERCRSLVQSTGRRPGAILIDQGYVKAEELLPLVRWHYGEIVYACFSWREGTFRLEPLSESFRPRIVMDLSTGALLLEGLRRRYEWDELLTLIGGADVVLKTEDDPPPGLAETELHLLELCDGTRSVASVIEQGQVERGQALAVLYGLCLLGVMSRPTPFDLPRVSHAKVDALAERARLEERIKNTHDADYFTLLGLSTDASGYEVRLAFERLEQELSPVRLGAVGAQDLDSKLEDTRHVVKEAFEILSDDQLRETYKRYRFE